MYLLATMVGELGAQEAVVVMEEELMEEVVEEVEVEVPMVAVIELEVEVEVEVEVVSGEE